MKGYWAPALLGVLGGLVLLVAAAAGWVDTVAERDVGGVTVTEPESTSGTVYAPVAVALGLGGLVGGAVLAVLRGKGRRIAGVAVAGIGTGGLIAVGLGIARASAVEGRITPAPFLALVAATALVAAGVAAARGAARPPAASRYRVADERSTDDEWTLAARDDPPA